MKFSFKIRNKDIVLNAWNTRIEKEFLLIKDSITNKPFEEKVDDIFHLFLDSEDKYTYLLPEDKIYLLICIRSKCVDELIDFTYICDKCKANVENFEDAYIIEGINYNEGVDVSIIKYNEYAFNIENFEIKGVSVDNVYYSISHNEDILDDIDIGALNYVNKYLKSSKPSISFKYTGYCPVQGCNHITEVVFSNTGMLEFLSNETVHTIYNFYVDMKEKANYSVFEINEMLPIERDIFFGMLDNMRKSKGTQGNADE